MGTCRATGGLYVTARARPPCRACTMHVASAAVHVASAAVRVASAAVHVASAAAHVASAAVHVASAAVHVASAAVHVASAAVHVASAAVHVASAAARECCNVEHRSASSSDRRSSASLSSSAFFSFASVPSITRCAMPCAPARVSECPSSAHTVLPGYVHPCVVGGVLTRTSVFCFFSGGALSASAPSLEMTIAVSFSWVGESRRGSSDSSLACPNRTAKPG